MEALTIVIQYQSMSPKLTVLLPCSLLTEQHMHLPSEGALTQWLSFPRFSVFSCLQIKLFLSYSALWRKLSHCLSCISDVLVSYHLSSFWRVGLSLGNELLWQYCRVSEDCHPTWYTPLQTFLRREPVAAPFVRYLLNFHLECHVSARSPACCTEGAT